MKIGQINFPDELIKALRNNELVVFAGAGVSMGEPANLPDFKELAREICREDPGEEPVDRFLGKCQKKGAQIHERAKGILNRDGLQYTQLHSDILRLFSGKEKTRLVTTNLDPTQTEDRRLFREGLEQGIEEWDRYDCTR